MAGAGLVQSTESLGKTSISATSGTESGTVRDAEAVSDPDLAAVAEAWPRLSMEVRQTILRLVE